MAVTATDVEAASSTVKSVACNSDNDTAVRRTDLEMSDNFTDEATAAEETCQYDGRDQSHDRSKALRADAPAFVPAAQAAPTVTECQVGTQVACSQKLPKADSDMRMNGAYNMHIEAVDAIKTVKRTATDVTAEEQRSNRTNSSRLNYRKCQYLQT
jgi:hypothetical protein